MRNFLRESHSWLALFHSLPGSDSSPQHFDCVQWQRKRIWIGVAGLASEMGHCGCFDVFFCYFAMEVVFFSSPCRGAEASPAGHLYRPGSDTRSPEVGTIPPWVTPDHIALPLLPALPTLWNWLSYLSGFTLSWFPALMEAPGEQGLRLSALSDSPQHLDKGPVHSWCLIKTVSEWIANPSSWKGKGRPKFSEQDEKPVLWRLPGKGDHTRQSFGIKGLSVCLLDNGIFSCFENTVLTLWQEPDLIQLQNMP